MLPAMQCLLHLVPWNLAKGVGLSATTIWVGQVRTSYHGYPGSWKTARKPHAAVRTCVLLCSCCAILLDVAWPALRYHCITVANMGVQ